MPHEPERGAPSRPAHPRGAPALAALLLTAGLVTVTVAPPATANGTTEVAGSSDDGPTATVEVRELSEVVAVEGVLRRTQEWVVRRGSSVAGATGSAATTTQPGATAATATMGRVLWFVDVPATETVEATAGAPGVEPTAEPSSDPSGEASGEPTGEPSTDPSGEPSGEPSGGPTAEPTDEPTGEPSSEPTEEPTGRPSTDPSDQPSGRPSSEVPGGQQAGPSDGPGAQAPPGQGQSGGPGAAPDAPAGAGGLGGLAPAGEGGPAGGAPATGEGAAPVADPVLTAVTAPGHEVVAGDELYALDAEPVVALVGDWVPWRDLGADSEDGPDVQALEQALVELGYGDGLTVDQVADDATGEAIRRWETDLGRSDPDGVLQPSEVVVVPAGTVVTDATAVLGQQVAGGADVLSLGSASLEAVVDVAAEDADRWVLGRSAGVGLPDDRVVDGVVLSVGRDLVDGTVEVVLDVAQVDGFSSGLPVDVVLVGEVTETTAVPLAAVRADDAGAAVVEVVEPVEDGSPGRAPVTLGVVDGGWVAVQGVPAGSVVRLPG
ncbi:peptidoglycan-binding protein [Aquipuribacter sp. MA13-6]|uniref:peptidoglycan-binding protein n=1 Tax=unclassified Aquipuribacter TaxID=2635084 RepID=UPI003EEB1C50